MNQLKFKNGVVEEYTIVLCTRDYRKLGQLTGLKNLQYSNNLNSANEITFSLTKHDLVAINGNTVEDIKMYMKIKNSIWKRIVDFKLVWIKELNEYFEIKVSTTDSLETSKTVTGTSLCEAELSQWKVTAEINTEQDIARDDYEITQFYNENNPKASLLHRVLQKAFASGYSIKYVDGSLKNIQRMFSINDSTIYDFLIGECSEQFNCLFQFDSSDRSISVYDLYTVCEDCGERGEFVDECPKCQGINLKYFGEDTTIYVDKENLTDSIQLETNTDNVKNCFKLVAGDDLMTATIRMLNPNGSDYIYHIPEYIRNDMPKELVNRLDEYDVLHDSYKEEYEQLVEDIYKLTDDIIYKESGMMPMIEQSEVTASTEARKLNEMNLSPLGLSSIPTYIDTVNSALKNYAKVYIKTGYVKIDIDSDATYEYVGKDDNGYHYGIWHGRFTVTNYSDEVDVVKSDYISVKVYDNYQDFVEQKVLKRMSQDDEDCSVFDVLSIQELEDFKSAIKHYCKSRLESFFNAIQTALDVLISLDQASEYADLYYVLYDPYYKKLQECQLELDIRQLEIDDLQLKLDGKDSRRMEIQKTLDFESFLGKYYPMFSAYRREDTYGNNNYISDGLNNAELIDKAKQFIEVAKSELLKSSEQQVSIDSTLYNLLIIYAFKPLVGKFKTGNWIRIRVDGVLYRLRLLGYTISFDNTQIIQTQFSNITLEEKEVDYDNEIQQILQSAKSMSSTYNYVAKQAEKGSVAQRNIQRWYENGINSAFTQIKNNENEEVTYGRHGLLLKERDDISNTYSDEQCKLTHNILAYTTDNWRSVKTALGKHKYTYFDKEDNAFKETIGYGFSADFMSANSVISSPQIIGGEMYSDNYVKNVSGEYHNLRNGDFQLAGGKFLYDSKTNELKITGVNIEWSTSTKPTIDNIDGLSSSLGNLESTANSINRFFSFNEDGFSISKSGSEIKTQITEDGMKVYKNNQSVLEANNKGVDAQNLRATTYLIIGENSRLENYAGNRTGCFWIGN